MKKNAQRGVSMGALIVFLALGLIITFVAIKTIPPFLRYHQMRVVLDEVRAMKLTDIPAVKAAYDNRTRVINLEEVIDSKFLTFIKNPDETIDIAFDYDFLVWRLPKNFDIKIRFVYSTAPGGYVYPEDAPQPAQSK